MFIEDSSIIRMSDIESETNAYYTHSRARGIFHLLTAGTKYIINTEKRSFHCLQKNFLTRQFPFSG